MALLEFVPSSYQNGNNHMTRNDLDSLKTSVDRLEDCMESFSKQLGNFSNQLHDLSTALNFLGQGLKHIVILMTIQLVIFSSVIVMLVLKDSDKHISLTKDGLNFEPSAYHAQH